MNFNLKDTDGNSLAQFDAALESSPCLQKVFSTRALRLFKIDVLVTKAKGYDV